MSGFLREGLPYFLRLTGFDFEAGSDPVPAAGKNGGQRVDPVTGQPVYAVDVLAHVRGQARSVKLPVSFTAPEPPVFGWRQLLVMDGLELVVRGGLANGRPFVREEFRAHNLRAVDAARALGVAA